MNYILFFFKDNFSVFTFKKWFNELFYYTDLLKKFIDQIFWTIYEIIYFIYKIISFFLNITKIKKFIFF